MGGGGGGECCFWDVAFSLAGDDLNLKANILVNKRVNAPENEKRETTEEAVKALKLALEQDKKTGESQMIHKMLLREAFADLGEVDEAIKYADGEPHLIGQIYERVEDLESARRIYEENDRFYDIYRILEQQGKHDEALDWRLRDIEVNEGGRFQDNSPEALQKRIKDGYQRIVDDNTLSRPNYEAIQTKICASARKKAAEMGINVSLLLPDCETE